MPRFSACAGAAFFLLACSSAPDGGVDHTTSTTHTSGSGGAAGTGGMVGTGGAAMDAGSMEDGGPEAGAEACSVDGNPGQCMDVSACALIADHTSTPGYCPGPANVECCTKTPDVADNPPVPAGWVLMMQSQVTPAMTTWAVAILHDPTDYPLFSTAMMTFDTLLVMARVEWHPPDFQNGVVHRGVTLYEPG
jgi:hypothetical protein